MTLLPWQRGVLSSDTFTDDQQPDVVVPIRWARRSTTSREYVHLYVQVPGIDNGADYTARIQAQYPWHITSITPAIVVSAITEGRP